MKTLIIIFLAIVLQNQYAPAQHSTSDLRDAGSLGPYPFYIGIGYTNSFDEPDLKHLSHEFSSYYGEGTLQKKLCGFQIHGGAAIIPANWRMSFVVEAKYIYMQRHLGVTDNSYTMKSQQVSFGIGMRYVLIPQFLTVFQAQVGPVLYYSTRYNFKLDGARSQVIKANNSNSIFNGCHVLARISIMDPAGTEGGWGLFFEWGYNFFSTPEGQPLSDAIRQFNLSYEGNEKGSSRYGYFTAGVILPLAIRLR